jgi:hypothetical protein
LWRDSSAIAQSPAQPESSAPVGRGIRLNRISSEEMRQPRSLKHVQSGPTIRTSPDYCSTRVKFRVRPSACPAARSRSLLAVLSPEGARASGKLHRSNNCGSAGRKYIEQDFRSTSPTRHENFEKSSPPFQPVTATRRRSPKSMCYSPDEKSCSVAEKQPFRGRVPIQSSRDTRSGPNAGATFLGCHRDLNSTQSGGMGAPPVVPARKS